MVEHYYSPNVSEDLVAASRSSSGSKGNQHLEKDLLFEVGNLLLGNLSSVPSRDLEKDSVSRLADKVTTKLRREKLQKEMTCAGDYETTRLYNSVAQVQSSARGKQLTDSEGNEIDELTEDDPEEVMESMEIVDEIDDCPDDDDTEDDNDEGGIFNKNCITDLWCRGWNGIDAMKYAEVKQRQEARMKRKRRAQIVILDKVREMKAESEASIIIDEEVEPEVAPLWRSVVHRFIDKDGNRYKSN
jgi:hypothetical protein